MNQQQWDRIYRKEREGHRSPQRVERAFPVLLDTKLRFLVVVNGQTAEVNTTENTRKFMYERA
jgi:hypothetical protein